MAIFVIGEANRPTSVGMALYQAAERQQLNPSLHEVEQAYQAPSWLFRINWHLRHHYPTRLNAFSTELVQKCERDRPTHVITTGLAPVSAAALEQIGRLGIQRINFLTDDPWNPVLYAPWFIKALPHYDVVCSPRRANYSDLIKAGCKRVEYVPFGYNSDLFYSEPAPPDQQPSADVFFAGGGDRDRVPYMQALVKAGFRLALYGGYWDRYPETRDFAQGHADIPTLRLAPHYAKLALCLVRQANRDGHCMRTFEVPAIGACMLTEDTPEHRDIFGAEGETVVYFKSMSELIEKTQWLLDHEGERQQLARNVHQLITQGGHTYDDRLKTMLTFN
jgi:spore maturation protein CgeB